MLLGPQRFSDLRGALPGVSSNLLTDRLRELEVRGLRLDDRVWTVAHRNGVLEIEPGDPAVPDAGIRTNPTTLNALLLDPGGLDDALATGAAEAEGDFDALRRLLTAVAPHRS